MGANWSTVRLGDYVDSCLGKMLDKKKNKGNPAPYIGNKNVRWGSFDIEDLSQMPFEEHESERYGIKYGDLIVCEGGEPGRCAIWKEQIPEMKIQKALHRVRAKEGLNNSFLYYWFLWAGKNGRLEPYFTGTTIKHLTGKALAELPVPKPPMDIQASIAKTLGGFDDKIELNRQINQTLEQMAQALFKSWFVDFDPVIDNALEDGNGIPAELQDRAERRKEQIAKPDHQPLPDDIRKLFPSEFEFTEEMGWVPKGWECRPVGKVIENVGGGTPQTKEDSYWVNGKFPFCTPKDMSGLTSKVLLNTERHLTDLGVSKISSGVLSVGTVLMSSRAPIGYLAITQTPVSVNQGVIALKPSEQFSSEYLLCWAETNMDQVISRANGSTFLEISKKNFRDIPFLIPCEKVNREFDRIVRPFFSRITALQIENMTLKQTRDRLLPKLISGDVEVTIMSQAGSE